MGSIHATHVQSETQMLINQYVFLLKLETEHRKEKQQQWGRMKSEWPKRYQHAVIALSRQETGWETCEGVGEMNSWRAGETGHWQETFQGGLPQGLKTAKTFF